MAVDQRLVISDLLCYASKKFGRVPIKPLKAVINDFYSADDICTAKDKLIEEIDLLNLDKWQKPARRRKDSITRTQNEIDDIFNSITLLDESMNIQRLPIFVSTDPDRMPSIKLTDGDLSCMLIKLGTIEQSIASLKVDVLNLPTKRDVSEIVKDKVGPSRLLVTGDGSTAGLYSDTGRHKITAPRRPPSGPITALTASEQLSLGHTSSDAGETSDAGGFVDVIRKRKKHKQSTSPSQTGQAGSAGSAGLSYASQVALPANPIVSNHGKPQPKLVIGASSSSALKASKSLIVKKSVFHLGNIDSVYSAVDVENYIRSLNIRILTCFELKQSKMQASDNKAFRVCIVAEDRAKLYNIDNWYVGVSVREWVHKPKKDSSAVAAAFCDPVEMIHDLEAVSDAVAFNSNSATASCSSEPFKLH